MAKYICDHYYNPIQYPGLLLGNYNYNNHANNPKQDDFYKKMRGFFYTVHPVVSILKFLWYRTHQKSKLKLIIPMEHLPWMRIAVVLL